MSFNSLFESLEPNSLRSSLIGSILSCLLSLFLIERNNSQFDLLL